jgi:putative addiction module component (TIGR02574 family)
MTENVRELHERVLGLPPDERAALLELLLASLEPKSAAQRAWAQLASRRREDVRSGRVNMVPGEEALARIRAKIA